MKKEKAELEREIKRNKNGLLMLNRVLDKEEVEWLYKNTKPIHQEWWIKENGKMVYYWPNWEKY